MNTTMKMNRNLVEKEAMSDPTQRDTQWKIRFTSKNGIEFVGPYSRFEDAVRASDRLIKHSKGDELAICTFINEFKS